MPYSSPQSDEAFREPVGLDAVLNDLRAEFNELSWLEGNVYLRAYDNTFPDEQGANVTHPQVYIGNGEYHNVMINDNLPAALFFKVAGPERIIFEKPANKLVEYERPLSLIFWCNLRFLEADFTADYIYTEVIKQQLIAVLGRDRHVKSITQFFDDNVQEVFDGYTIPEGKQYSKYPFASVRINFTVNYKTGVKPCYPNSSLL